MLLVWLAPPPLFPSFLSSGRIDFKFLRTFRALAGVSQGSRISLQWSGLNWSELPPLQSGHCGLMLAISMALGPDFTTSMMKEERIGI